MFIKIVPLTSGEEPPSQDSIIYEGEEVRIQLFTINGGCGMGEYENLLREPVESPFFKENKSKLSAYETILIWFKDKNGINRVLETPLSSVFIMNDSGKTIDRLDAEYSSGLSFSDNLAV